MTAAMTVRKVRQRFTPEKRRELILDFTAELVAQEGVATLTMERIAARAGISKALVYRYFPTTTVLLRTLLQRELHQLRTLQAKAAETATGFEDLVRSVTRVYLAYIEARGSIIEKLQSEPSVSDSRDPTDYVRDRAVDYLAKIAAREFDLPDRVAWAATDISFGLPTASGNFLIHHDYSRQEIEDIAVNMIIGSFLQLAQAHHRKSGAPS